MEGLKAEKREKKTKGFLNQIKKSGKVPAVCYNSSLDNISLSVDKSSFEELYEEKANHIAFDLIIEGDRKRKVLIKQLQYEPLHKELIHIDFYEISDDVELNTMIPIKLIGDSIGVKLGGVLEHKLNKLKIKALPKYIPSTIEIDITDLDVGDSVYVRDLPIDSNVTVLANETQSVCSCSQSRLTKLDEDEEETLEEGEEGTEETTEEKTE